MGLSEKLQMLRNNSRISQEELADTLGVSRQAVSKWESGQSTPDLKKLIRIAEIYNVTIDSLVKDELDINILETQGDNMVNQETVESEKKNTTQIVINLNSNFIEYEYKSKRELFGIPLIHINIGRGLKKAKGIIAIGNLAYGLISIGLMSFGIISFGVLALGMLSLGALSIGLLLSIGAISIGFIAIGAISIGVFSLGALAIGKYAVGASAIASNIAVGDYAKSANIAIGNSVVGLEAIKVEEYLSVDKVLTFIRREYPGLTDFFIRIIELAIESIL